MKDFYSESGITLYCAKAEEILPHLSNRFGVLVLDPPYSLHADRMDEHLSKFRNVLTETAEALLLPFLNMGYRVEYGLPFARPVEKVRAALATTCGDILDPYAGVGSTLIAAKLLGRNAVGIEMDPKRSDVIVERLKSTCDGFPDGVLASV